MGLLETILSNLPEVKGPLTKRLPFKEKLKWTGIILIAFFILGVIPLYGLSENVLAQFDFLSIILAANFGSLLSLGIGPIVTASIVLQLLNGSGLLKFDLTTSDGRKRFQGVQKILAIFFIIFEAMVFVFLGGLSPDATLAADAFRSMQFILIFQLFLGGMLVLYMDEIINKWGFGSGVSLFIAAGVSAQLFSAAFSPLNRLGALAFGSGQAAVGKIWVLISSLAAGVPTEALSALFAILFTIVVFVVAVYVQAMKVEIPLSFGRVRGHGIRWPLRFIYTSNIPVILTAALLANMQLWARLLQSRVGEAGIMSFISKNIIGQFAGNVPVSGIAVWLFPSNIVDSIIRGSFTFFQVNQALMYTLILMAGSVLFAVFWVQTAGMDARSQANQILASGLQIPGFRRDPRVLESILSRYIMPLTVMGALTVGFIAASADWLGALTRGMGILLTVMIIYRLYEEIAQQHMLDMHPMLRKFMGQ